MLNLGVTLFFIINDQFKEVKTVRSGFWKLLTLPITGIYFLECAMVIFTTGGGTIIREKKLYLIELLCQAVSVWAYLYMFDPNAEDGQYATGASLLTFAFMLRNLRLTVLLEEVKAFKIVMQMIMKMTVPILYMLACLYVVYYLFAIIGMYGLGGKILQPNFHSEDGIPNNLYYLVNFNDLGSSMATLYAFMIINNWPAITDTMCNAAGGAWPRIYFMIFYIIVQWIVLNIIIAMMLEIFTNVEQEMDTEFHNLKNIQSLMKTKKQVGDRVFHDMCDSVNEDICKEEVEKSNLFKRYVESKHDKALKGTNQLKIN